MQMRPRQAASPQRYAASLIMEDDRMQIDLAAILAKAEAGHWTLSDFDWEQPGAETMTPDQRAEFKPFMTDLVWIEQIGSRGFGALAQATDDATLKRIYRLFQAEEQRHANAELKLMERWGMIEPGERPLPNINIQMAIKFLDRYADNLPLSVLGAVIPMLEIALDGALLKFFLEKVEDPLCHEVFERINADEARHLGVDFHVLENIGQGPYLKNLVEFVGNMGQPLVLGTTLFTYFPLLQRARASLQTMGLGSERLKKAFRRYQEIGDRSPALKKNPMYLTVREHAKMLVNDAHPYHLLANLLVSLSDHLPARARGRDPDWLGMTTRTIV